MDSSAANSRNPVVEEREVTDKFFGCASLLIDIPIIVVVTLAPLLKPDLKDDDASYGPFFDKIISVTKEMKMEDKFAEHMIVHSIYALLCILLIKLFTTPLIFIGMIVNVLRTLYTSYALTNKTINGSGMDEYLAFAFGVWIFARIVSAVAGLASLYKIDMNVPRNIIRNSSRVICHSFMMIIVFGLFLFVGYSMVTLYKDLAHDYLRSVRQKNFNLFMYTSIILSVLILFVWYHKLFFTTISHYTIDHYWKNDEKPRIWQSIKKIYKFHSVTVSMATKIPIPWICAIDQASEHSRPQEKKDNIIFYLICKTSLILSMPIDALIFTSIYGTGFVKSSQMAFDVVLRRCKVFLATTWVIEALVDLITVSYFCIDMLVDQDTYKGDGVEDTILTFYSLLDFVTVPYPSFLSLLYVCARALLINQIIILSNED